MNKTSILRVKFKEPITDYFKGLGNRVIPIPSEEVLAEKHSLQTYQLDVQGLENVTVLLSREDGEIVGFRSSDKDKGESDIHEIEFHLEGEISNTAAQAVVKRCQQTLVDFEIPDNEVVFAELECRLFTFRKNQLHIAQS